MKPSVIISQHVINTVKSLPEADRKAIAEALAAEVLLGENPDTRLTPFQAMLYTMIKFYVDRDTNRQNVAEARLCAG